MSCLRRDEAFSICNSSAKASSSAGVFRFSSWRFIEFFVVSGQGSPVFGALARTESGRLQGNLGMTGRYEETGVRRVGSLTECRYASQTRLQGLGSTSCGDYRVK